MSIWTSGSKTTTPEELAARAAIHERYLSSLVMTPRQYLTRLRDQARGASVSSMRETLIDLFPNESESKNEASFMKRVHQARRLRNIWSIRYSPNVADVPLE